MSPSLGTWMEGLSKRLMFGKDWKGAGCVVSQINLLFFLDPGEAINVDASEKKLTLITAMMDKRWKVHVTSSRMVRYEKLTCDHEVHKVTLISSADSILSRMLYLVFLIYKGVKIVKRHNIHVVMCKGGYLFLGLAAYLTSRITSRACIVRVNFNAFLATILALQRLRVPILSSGMFSGAIGVTLRTVETFLLKHVDWVVTHGPKDYERIKKLTAKVTSIPSWVNTEMFEPMSKDKVKQLKNELLEMEEDGKAILFVGRLHPMKDIKTLFYAYKKVLETHRNVILVVAGSGPEEKKCRKLVERLGLINKVKFLGYIPHEQIAKYYNIVDIYVLTSVWEEWSNTIMEAMASGVPVIATNVGGNPYLVKNKETGFLVPPKSPHVLAEKIRYVLDHSNEMEKITSNAYLSVRKFNKRNIGELYKKTIVRVINARAHKRNRQLA